MQASPRKTISRRALGWFLAFFAAVCIAAGPLADRAEAAESADADRLYTQMAHEAARYYGISEWAFEHAMRCESMNYHPGVRTGRIKGSAGEVGFAQLHPAGKLPVFFSERDREGDYHTNPYSPWQAFDFAARHIAANPYLDRNGQHAWSCWKIVTTTGPASWWWLTRWWWQ